MSDQDVGRVIEAVLEGGGALTRPWERAVQGQAAASTAPASMRLSTSAAP